MPDFRDPRNGQEPFGPDFRDDPVAPVESILLYPRVSVEAAVPNPTDYSSTSAEGSFNSAGGTEAGIPLLPSAGLTVEPGNGLVVSAGESLEVGHDRVGFRAGPIELLESAREGIAIGPDPQFCLGQIGTELKIASPLPSRVRIPLSGDESQEAIADRGSPPFEDPGWFYELAKSSNRYRPAPERQLDDDGQYSRPCNPSRLWTSPRLRVRAFNPFRGRAQKRCRRCGVVLENNWCPGCSAEFCEWCGELLTDSKCTNEICPNHYVERCGNCGEEICACGA